jgi:hypothetical protein
MRAAHRWSIVTVGVAVLCGLPWLIGHRPIPGSSLSATSLLNRIQNSAAHSYSGYSEADGGLGLPVAGDFDSVADLLGGHSEERVWWRTATDERVDTITAFGESDVHTDALGTWTWNYERSHATRVPSNDSAVRLPRNADVLPPDLGRRLLSQALPSEVSRLPVVRIAGVDAVGLRLRPSEKVSTVTRVDVWADPVSGLPLRVQVYGSDQVAPAMSASFLDFSRATPSESSVSFAPPGRSRVDYSYGFDIASATNTFQDVTPPAQLAGLTRQAPTQGLGSVGVYGRGVTQLVAGPIFDGVANQLSAQLRTAGADQSGNEQSFTVGPVSALLLNSDIGRDWLFTGTVTMATLKAAAAQIIAHPPTGRQQ